MHFRITTYGHILPLAALFVFGAEKCFDPLLPEDVLKAVRENSATTETSGTVAGDPSLLNFENVEFRAVKRYSALYGVDYRLILAIIKQESQFDEQARSGRGAIGLMQVMPVTAMEIRDKLDLAGTGHPIENIRVGVYYFSKLYSRFKGAKARDRVRLALAAYNAGPARICDAQVLAAYIGENPGSWSSIQSTLPLLSKRCYSLHETVWPNGKPPSGYFGEANQTIDYVSSVVRTYSEYQSAM
ncbi:MAG TPA: transglycosylase SLT domain-containing protein [Bacteroidota bacterium]|nr:transglycosylase SLT domain-containing protein [Bacteroidota bacterium]